ncbi:MAG: hypothetical protein LBT05_05405 [Planctomycetaceae bacterium]|nr:hypothetical protein [Planctomycetaceae bacterium]
MTPLSSEKRVDLRNGSQDSRKRACREDRLSDGVRHGGTGQGGIEGIEMQSKNQHVFYRTTQRH